MCERRNRVSGLSCLSTTLVSSKELWNNHVTIHFTGIQNTPVSYHNEGDFFCSAIIHSSSGFLETKSNASTKVGGWFPWYHIMHGKYTIKILTSDKDKSGGMGLPSLDQSCRSHYFHRDLTGKIKTKLWIIRIICVSTHYLKLQQSKPLMTYET